MNKRSEKRERPPWLICLPGKRDRRSKPIVEIGLDGKPIRTPMIPIKGRKPA